MTVQSKDGPSVRMDIADGFQLAGDHLCLFQSGQKDQAVHLPHPVVFLID